VGAADGFAVLAERAIAALDPSQVTGNLGVSGAPVQNITGFDQVQVLKFGTDSSAPNSMRTILTQGQVDALVDDIDVRACNADDVSLERDAAAELTIRPGVTCLRGSGNDVTLGGRIVLDAGGDPNAFFVIRADSKLNVNEATQLVLVNGAQSCGVFWRVGQQVTIGKGVEFFGTVVADTGISIGSGSKLVGRALARTDAVILDGSSITLPVYSDLVSAATCTHVQ